MADNSGNRRDRSEAAEARRAERSHIMDFTGWFGLLRSLINHKPGTVFQEKPKRGWAAKWRRKPFQNFLDDEGMEKARLRHPWYRRQKEREAQLHLNTELGISERK